MKAHLLAAALQLEALARLLGLPAQERKVVPTRLPLKLHGTLVAQDARYSLAVIERRTVAVGDRVEQLTVRSITKGCVELDDQELCMQPRTSDAPDRQLRHVALADFTPWPQVRIVPVPNGFKLFAIPKSSIYEKLGVQSGDIVRTVNGKPVDFSVLPLVKPGAVLRVELEREGQLYALEGQLD